MFNRSSLLAAVAVASLPLATTPIVYANTSDTATRAMSGTIIENRSVHDLRAYAEPDAAYPAAGQRAPQPILLPEDALVFDADSYALAIDPESMPQGTVADNGLTNFRIVAFDAEQNPLGETSGTVRLATMSDGQQVWIDPLLDTQTSSTLLAPDVVGGITADLTALVGADAPVDPTSPLLGDDESETPTEDDLGPHLAPDAKLVGGCSYPEGAGDVVVNRKSVSTTIGTGYPVRGDKSWMSHTEGSSAEYNGTFGIANDNVGYWQQSSTKSIARASGFEWAAKDYARSYRVKVEYVKIAHYYGQCPPAEPYYYTWRPARFDGGYGENAGITRPDFKNCRQIGSDGTWWRNESTGKSYSLSYGVKFAGTIGIDLSSKRAYDSEAMLAYRISANRWVCGNNDVPSHAGKVMERLKNA